MRTLLIALILIFTIQVAVAEAPDRPRWEPTPPCRLAAPAGAEEVRPGSSVLAETEDYALLARVIYAEARGEPYDGQVGVAAVVMNRIQDDRWPDTVTGVVHQRVNGQPQFAVSRGTRPPPELIDAARAAVAGEDPTNGATYFYSPELASCTWILSRETTADIGGHRFAR